MKILSALIMIGLSAQAIAAWEPAHHIRTFDGDWIERGTTVDQLEKLNARREGSEKIVVDGQWQTVSYYAYKTYEANFRIKVIAGRVADIQWSR